MSCLRVSELNDRAREALSDCFGPDVWVVGEIHGFKAHAKSGHAYFDLVEKASSGTDQYIAKVGCAFFQGALKAWQRSLAAMGLSGFELASGIEVKLRARVDLFTKEGRYQLVVSEIDPSYTYGAIARRRAQTMETLKASGLMVRNKGQELPAIPLNIGLITSRGSAAYQDFTSIILKSGFSFRITLYDAHMQGDRAIQEVTRGIMALEKYPGLDAIVITRGGGAKTDLFVFDDISICKAIATCPKPVITGIGHEIDLTVADLVAHSSFVTPTDAARFLVSQVDGIWSFLEGASGHLHRSARSALDTSSRQLDLTSSRLALLSQKLAARARSTLEATATALLTRGFSLTNSQDRRLLKVCSAFSQQAASCLHTQASILEQDVLRLRLNASSLISHLRHALRHRLALMLQRLSSSISGSLKALDQNETGLKIMTPQLTLHRGYSITYGKDGRALRDANDAAMDDCIRTMLAQGTIHSVICDKEP